MQNKIKVGDIFQKNNVKEMEFETDEIVKVVRIDNNRIYFAYINESDDTSSGYYLYKDSINKNLKRILSQSQCSPINDITEVKMRMFRILARKAVMGWMFYGIWLIVVKVNPIVFRLGVFIEGYSLKAVPNFEASSDLGNNIGGWVAVIAAIFIAIVGSFILRKLSASFFKFLVGK